MPTVKNTKQTNLDNWHWDDFTKELRKVVDEEFIYSIKSVVVYTTEGVLVMKALGR